LRRAKTQPPASFPITLDRRVNSIEQILIVKRLGEELDGACLNRPDAHWDVPLAGDENHGSARPSIATSF
jgi:hypothetical protein